MSALLDTNVLLRYLTGDSPDLARQAVRILDDDDDLILTDGVLAEVAYVLTSQYGSSREATVDALIGLVQRTNVVLYALDKDIVVGALSLCRPSGRVSFADALLWAVAHSAGIRTIYTLDNRFPATGVELRTAPPDSVE